MTNSPSKLSYREPDDSHDRRFVNSPIPIQRAEAKKGYVKGKYTVMKCRVSPEKDSLGQYKVHIPYFHQGTAEEWLKWRSNL